MSQNGKTPEEAALDRVRELARAWATLKASPGGGDAQIAARVGRHLLDVIHGDSGSIEERLHLVTSMAEGWLSPGADLFYPAAAQCVLDAIKGDAAAPAVTAYTDEQIAAAAHTATMALQALDNDESPALPWMCEDPDIKALTINGVRLARILLPQNNGDTEKTADQLHAAWCDGKRAQGWVYGTVKDRERKTHPCLRPRGELPEHQQVKDRLLVTITAALAGEDAR